MTEAQLHIKQDKLKSTLSMIFQLSVALNRNVVDRD